MLALSPGDGCCFDYLLLAHSKPATLLGCTREFEGQTGWLGCVIYSTGQMMAPYFPGMSTLNGAPGGHTTSLWEDWLAVGAPSPSQR